MKVLLYFENHNQIKKSGIGRALKHQIEALTSAGIEYTLDPKDTYDIAHINTYFFKSKRLLKRLKKKGIPVIVHGHSTKEDFQNSFALWKVMALWFYPNLLWFYSHADLIITPTEYSKRVIDSYGTKVPTIAISNGINREEYQYKEENVEAFKKHFNIKEGQKVVIGIGFYFQRKGIHDFFEVARTMPEITFIWFGYLAPILTTNFIKKAIKHKPDNVILPGYIAGSIMQGALHYTDCLFFPSYEETEGIVVLESLACNKPVLLRDIGVYEGWTEDGINCFKAKTNEEFKEKLLYILNNDCSDVVNNGQKLIDTRTLSVVGKELKAAYTDLIEQFKNKNNL